MKNNRRWERAKIFIVINVDPGIIVFYLARHHGVRAWTTANKHCPRGASMICWKFEIRLSLYRPHVHGYVYYHCIHKCIRGIPRQIGRPWPSPSSIMFIFQYDVIADPQRPRNFFQISLPSVTFLNPRKKTISKPPVLKIWKNSHWFNDFKYDFWAPCGNGISIFTIFSTFFFFFHVAISFLSV